MGVVLQTRTLDNGLRVVVESVPGAATTGITLAFRAGNRYETRETNGFTHFDEHMFAHSGVRYPTKEAVTAAVKGYGGSRNAYTSNELVALTARLPVSAFGFGLGVMADIVLHTAYTDENVDTERGAVLQEIAQAQDSVARHADLALAKLFYAEDCPLGWDTLGTAENIHRARREDLLAIREGFCCGTNAVLAVAGGVEAATVLREAERRFRSLPVASRCPLPKSSFAPAPEGERIVSVSLVRAQVHLRLALPLPAQPLSERLPLTLLNAFLDDQLFNEVRTKRGLAYSAGSQYYAEPDYGAIVCFAAVDLRNVVETVATIVDTFRRVLTTLTDENCAWARRFLSGMTLVWSEQHGAVADRLACTMLLEGEAVSSEHLAARFRRVPNAAIRAAAAELLENTHWKLALAGPVDSAMIEALGDRVPCLT